MEKPKYTCHPDDMIIREHHGHIDSTYIKDNIFYTFKEAKADLIHYHKSCVDNAKAKLKAARKLTINDSRI